MLFGCSPLPFPFLSFSLGRHRAAPQTHCRPRNQGGLHVTCLRWEPRTTGENTWWKKKEEVSRCVGALRLAEVGELAEVWWWTRPFWSQDWIDQSSTSALDGRSVDIIQIDAKEQPGRRQQGQRVSQLLHEYEHAAGFLPYL